MSQHVDDATAAFRGALLALLDDDTVRAMRHARALLLALVRLMPETRRTR